MCFPILTPWCPHDTTASCPLAQEGVPYGAGRLGPSPLQVLISYSVVSMMIITGHRTKVLWDVQQVQLWLLFEVGHCFNKKRNLTMNHTMIRPSTDLWRGLGQFVVSTAAPFQFAYMLRHKYILSCSRFLLRWMWNGDGAWHGNAVRTAAYEYWCGYGRWHTNYDRGCCMKVNILYTSFSNGN